MTLCLAAILTSCSTGSRNTIPITHGGQTVLEYLYSTSAPANGTGTEAAVFKVETDGSLTSMGTALQSSMPTMLLTNDAKNHVFGVSVPKSGLPSVFSYGVSIATGALRGGNDWELSETSGHHCDASGRVTSQVDHEHMSLS